MAEDIAIRLYESTLTLDDSFMQTTSIDSCETQLMMEYYQQMRYEEIVHSVDRMSALSYLFLKRTWNDWLSSILTIQQIARCDRDAKETTRRGHQVYKNVEKLLNTSDRSLCSQFVDVFRNCADYDELCSEREVEEFWTNIKPIT